MTARMPRDTQMLGRDLAPEPQDPDLGEHYQPVRTSAGATPGQRATLLTIRARRSWWMLDDGTLMVLGGGQRVIAPDGALTFGSPSHTGLSLIASDQGAEPVPASLPAAGTNLQSLREDCRV